MAIHLIKDDDLLYGDIFAHISLDYNYGVTKRELVRLNGKVPRSDFVTGKVKEVVLSEED